MSFAILKFDLSNPDDAADHKMAVAARDLATALWDLDQWLRSEIKYRDQAALQPARTKLNEILTEKNLHEIVES